MHTAYTETLFAPRPRKNIGVFLEPMRFMFSHGDHIQRKFSTCESRPTENCSWTEFEMDLSDWLGYDDNKVCSQSVNAADAFVELHDVISRSWYYRYVEICTQVKNTNFTFLYNVNNGCTDDVQRSSCLTREELSFQQPHSEEKQHDSFISRANQEVLFPLQQERIVSPISRAQNPIPYNSSFMMHNPHHLHVTILKRALSPNMIMRIHANESPLAKVGFITSSRRHSI